MPTIVVMDDSGCIVIPENARQELRLEGGDELTLESCDDVMTLRPVLDRGRLIKKQGFWVLAGAGKGMTVEMTNAMIEEDRLERERRLMGEGD